MENKRVEKLELEDAKLMGGKFKNFSGKANDYNREGSRYINVVIPEEYVSEIADKGWVVKELPPREEGDAPVYFMKVNIRFQEDGGYSDPKIYKGISQDNMHKVTVETVGDLDKDEIEHVDIVIRPYHWSRKSGEEGIAAYLDEMYVIIKGSRFTAKYSVADEED
ncbi:MAG: hypothetical protein J6Y02_06355 [Pseudobutyrivibrio sp.]|nr:hypothetical protein [Pseudobutyrivibrio sp.]